MAAIEALAVIARIFLINKLSATTLPMQTNFMFRHTFAIRCAVASRKQSTALAPTFELKAALRRQLRGARLPFRLFGQISGGWRALDSINVPRPIDCYVRQGVCLQPCFMDHLCRQVIKSARLQFGALPFARTAAPEIMVCDSLAVCQCFRT